MQLADLSSELLLAVTDSLSVFDLLNLRLVSSFWYHFLQTHESTIYHSACILHGFAKPHQLLENAIKEHRTEKQDMKDIDSWKTFCQYNVLLSRYWRMADSSRPPRPTVIERTPFTSHVPHRIKIDPSEGLILNTSGDGGLFVRCAKTHKDLWCIYQEAAVRQYAHLEYSSGFAIFDRGENCHEVWVKRSILPSLRVSCKPTLQQERNGEKAMDFENDPDNPSRGCMVPFGLLRSPIRTRAFRFVYPLLLVTSGYDRRVVIWHVPTLQILEEFSIEEEDAQAEAKDPSDDINYVELSATHVFVSLSNKLVVFERGQVPPELNIPQGRTHGTRSSPKAGRKVFEFSRESLWNDTRLLLSRANVPFKHSTSVIKPYQWITDANGMFPIAQETEDGIMFTAVHVSPDGDNFVAVSAEGLILYVENMLEVIDTLDKAPTDSPIEWDDQKALWVLCTGKWMSNLAYDGLKAVFSTPEELCILHLKDPLDRNKPFLLLEHELLTVVMFDKSDDAMVSCLQISESNIWYTYVRPRFHWHGDVPNEFVDQIVVVDFVY